MGFIRRQEERFAMRLLTWQCEKKKLPLPSAQQLAHQAREIVDEAHRIARQRGQNVIGIVKELVADIKQR